METSNNLTVENTGEQLTLFAEASPVSRTPLPGSERAQVMTVTSGRKCLELFEKFNRPGLLAKTFPALLIGQKGWYSRKCNLIWKLKATRYNRLYFQLQASVPRTEGIESGLLPTPTVMAEAEGKMKSTQQKEGSRHSVGLGSAMVMGLLPTPQSRDEKHGSKLEDSRTARKIEQGWSFGINDLATMGLLPTPAAQDIKNKTFPQSQQNRDSIPGAIMRQGQPGKFSQLNHRFVMEMMGFPPTWCDIYYEMAEIAIQKKRQRKKPKG